MRTVSAGGITRQRARAPIDYGGKIPIHDLRYLSRSENSNKAFYRSEDGHLIVATRLKNLNINGACLFVNDDVQVGQKLMLKIFLDEDHNFEVAGTVIWRIRDGTKKCAGLAFDQLDDEAQEMIVDCAFEF